MTSLKYGSHPVGKCTATAGDVLIGLRGWREAADRAVHESAHGGAAQDAGAGEGAEVVDDVEWAGGCVQGGGEPARDDVGDPAETLDQGEQGADDEKAEQHVEEQLSVRPLRAVGRGAKLGGSSGVEQVVEVCRDPLQVGVDVASVHRPSMECGDGSTVTLDRPDRLADCCRVGRAGRVDGIRSEAAARRRGRRSTSPPHMPPGVERWGVDQRQRLPRHRCRHLTTDTFVAGSNANPSDEALSGSSQGVEVERVNLRGLKRSLRVAGRADGEGCSTGPVEPGEPFHGLAKVRVAGSNPVVRSIRNPRNAGVSSRSAVE